MEKSEDRVLPNPKSVAEVIHRSKDVWFSSLECDQLTVFGYSSWNVSGSKECGLGGTRVNTEQCPIGIGVRKATLLAYRSGGDTPGSALLIALISAVAYIFSKRLVELQGNKDNFLMKTKVLQFYPLMFTLVMQMMRPSGPFLTPWNIKITDELSFRIRRRGSSQTQARSEIPPPTATRAIQFLRSFCELHSNLMRICSARRPNLAPLYFGASITNLMSLVVRSVKSGLPFMDINAAAWSGYGQSFIQGPGDEKPAPAGFILRCDMWRILYVTREYSNPPLTPWKPFGEVDLNDRYLHGPQQGGLPNNACPNMILDEQGGDSRQHAVDSTTLVQLVKRQLDDNMTGTVLQWSLFRLHLNHYANIQANNISFLSSSAVVGQEALCLLGTECSESERNSCESAEFEGLEHVAQYTSIPVPKVHRTYCYVGLFFLSNTDFQMTEELLITLSLKRRRKLIFWAKVFLFPASRCIAVGSQLPFESASAERPSPHLEEPPCGPFNSCDRV
ncbi:hypothetical protein P175DRAFT_0531142 [Aspergillus ochraceoroseus IBT 24754]|uniref:Uncharacterized protein n=1 Tax=Aspergillus ochraceoroseus IBT 24754 TaxID=1392256 RepID=A0A2T5LZB1_9EURO|nr:uncharacterized protein P175DRAFT_0531142 [Aspergillus ochraceoroseus IBT 24754]PTU21620.1 hypothetical protein P175DRAFT_0531142 [Aspergillus ochraceoroseus IBT 24754]